MVVDNGGTDWLTPVATLLAVLIGSWTSWLAQSKLADRRAVTEAHAAKEQREAEATAMAEQRAAERQAVAEQHAAEDAVAARLREAEEKAAARVVQADLALAASHLQNMVQRDQRWFGFYTFALPHWDQHEALLARRLSPEDWEVVSQSALELTRHEEGMRRAVGPGGPQEGAQVLSRDSEAAQRGLQAMWENASKAHRVLAPLAGTEPEEGLLHEGAP